MKKMRVLVLIDAWLPFVGGAQMQIKNLRKILEKNYGVQYLILHSPSSNILVRFLWSFWVIPQSILFILRQKLTHGREWKIDLIHAHAYWPGLPGKILALLLRIPIVFTVHGSNLLDLKEKSFRAWLEKIILTQIRYDQVISVSRHFLQYKNVNKNIKVIANGVDVNKFKIKIEIKNLKNKKSTILFVGRDDPIKGLRYLKQAMIEIKQKMPQTELKIIQKGYSRQELINEYLKADVFVLPSLSEGQPLTLLEAWAAKLPVVVTNVGDNHKFVKNGHNGYLVKPKHVKGLAEAIVKVLKDKNRDKLGKQGYQLVKQKYSWEKCAQQTYEIYQKIIKQ